jgi:PleD family two-component response regulator
LLIVDDKDDVRESMREYVRRCGIHCETAASAEDALIMLNSVDYDVVVTDIQFPTGMGGLELTQVVKRDYKADVIVMTGYSSDYSYEEAVRIGASDFIIKPFRTEELLLRIRRVLRERELTEERNRMMEKLQKLAVTDGLTMLFNSRHFYSVLELEVDRSNRYKHPLSLLLIDIDHFKDYNDS